MSVVCKFPSCWSSQGDIGLMESAVFKLFSSSMVAQCNPEVQAGQEVGAVTLTLDDYWNAVGIRFAKMELVIAWRIVWRQWESWEVISEQWLGRLLTKSYRGMEKREGIKDPQRMPQKISALERGKEYSYTAAPSSEGQTRNELEHININKCAVNSICMGSKECPSLHCSSWHLWLTSWKHNIEAEVCRQNLTQSQAVPWTVW